MKRIGQNNDAEQKMEDFRSSEGVKVTSHPAVMLGGWKQSLTNGDADRSSNYQQIEIVIAHHFVEVKNSCAHSAFLSKSVL